MSDIFLANTYFEVKFVFMVVPSIVVETAFLRCLEDECQITSNVVASIFTSSGKQPTNNQHLSIAPIRLKPIEVNILLNK